MLRYRSSCNFQHAHVAKDRVKTRLNWSDRNGEENIGKMCFTLAKTHFPQKHPNLDVQIATFQVTQMVAMLW